MTDTRDRAARDPLEALRELCLPLPEVVERPSHGSPTWFIRGKTTFVSFVGEHHGNRLAFWCAAPPGAAAELISEDPDRFFRPPYVGHRGWLGVYLDVAVDWTEIAEIVLDAYRAVAPRRLAAALPDRPGPSARA
ncbi:MmcQ/YjbR family DNA-binding protein [Frankia sp. CNm7]|uniref:MmcQ/YjbR family DNA-binding protein n=1 Tax=Frankia nepalensis TaxID=1836974 RepID=A0A937RQP7_9ACTN|nr:MmcQ/YjbR family DNA-binding protein [Frankia nepalensis]MBL7497522.1 MmcQ/YjbR family DNA-binding protein [Frankia nepalensis]MBL7510212.1 MmcQ/YjbR family DNA-binding protein [Frankia nepalensis]MBL7518980.1 MmcQ/YjbR family DNA-binding protein [Frankia nepalensis]MBL7630923.1 MmcQ/YjbR family DNA-binding protein [Frankia nepalensis]